MQLSLNDTLALIAEDDASIRTILTEGARLAGLSSVAVKDGRQAVQVLADIRPAVALLAVQMPGLSGIEVCWWMRRQRHLGKVPVILISAQTSQFEIDAGTLAGANHLMTRTFTSGHVRAVIGRHLANRPDIKPQLP